MKSSGFAAHENLDAINLAIQKQTASSSRLPGWFPLRRVFVNEQQSNSREQGNWAAVTAVAFHSTLRTSSRLFTRRASVVISEAVSGGGWP